MMIHPLLGSLLTKLYPKKNNLIMIINNIIFNGYENNNIHDIKNGYYFGICLLETKQNRVK